MEIHQSEYDRYKQHKKRRTVLIGAVVAAAIGGSLVYSQMQIESAKTPEQHSSAERKYPLHENITATVFWAGEDADNSNDFIHNRSSAWMTDWVAAYGGVDDPNNRCGYAPCEFTPKENPFYVALPFGDYNENGLKPDSDLAIIPWYDGKVEPGTSLLKNRWVAVIYNDKTAYGQWEDVGPFEDNDAEYVFGSSDPKEPRAGLDMSPALADYLDVNGRATVSWHFIDEADVPAGEWKEIVTRSDPIYK